VVPRGLELVQLAAIMWMLHFVLVNTFVELFVLVNALPSVRGLHLGQHPVHAGKCM
jgi:hypothetical protein